MEIAEYFGQHDYYFSESAQQLTPLSEMAFPHLYHARRKLIDEFGEEFLGTPLERAMWAILTPSSSLIRMMLRDYGKVAHAAPHGIPNPIRAKFYSAAKRGGMKVTTHMEKVGPNSGWVTAERVDVPDVRVKAH